MLKRQKKIYQDAFAGNLGLTENISPLQKKADAEGYKAGRQALQSHCRAGTVHALNHPKSRRIKTTKENLEATHRRRDV